MDELSSDSQGKLAISTTVRLAARQFGVVARWQLIPLGVGRDTTARWVAGGWLHEVYPRIYAVGNRRLSEEGWLAAALLYAGPGAALSHGTAAWWWRLTDRKPSCIDVAARKRRKSLSGVRVRTPRTITRLLHRSLPVTPVPQTLLDYASGHSLDDIRYVLSQADYRGLLNIRAIDFALGRGHRGAQKLRIALQAHRPEFALTRSELERKFIELCEGRGLPIPQINAEVCGFRVDAYWPEHRVVVELDGHQGHRSKAQLERDHRRDLCLRAEGLTPLRYSWGQVLREPDTVHADLTAVLHD